jgi:hypothetical protein
MVVVKREASKKEQTNYRHLVPINRQATGMESGAYPTKTL